MALESRLAEALLGFDRLDAAWPRGRTAIERAEIGRRNGGTTSINLGVILEMSDKLAALGPGVD